MRLTAPQLPAQGSPKPEDLDIRPRLTGREEEALSQISRGKSIKEMAFALTITERTAKYHVASILKKFHVSSRLELLAKLFLART